MDLGEFLAAARKLTVDRSGNNADSDAFDPENIDVFGVSFPSWWGGYLPMIYSNGGQLASDDGKRLMLNEPEAVAALHLLMAASTVVIAPVPVLFLFAQRYFIEGITLTGIKA